MCKQNDEFETTTKKEYRIIILFHTTFRLNKVRTCLNNKMYVAVRGNLILPDTQHSEIHVQF